MSFKLNFKPQLQVNFPEHRSGWGYAINSLKSLHDDNSTILIDGFIEKTHSWQIKDLHSKKIVPYDNLWIGFLHNPPRIPSWSDIIHSPQIIIRREIFQESLKNCLGIFTLSNYLKNWLQPKINCPVNSLIHPTEIPDLKFSFRKWKLNNDKKVIALGYWLRKLFSIQELPTKLTKLWLVPGNNAKYMQEREARSYDTVFIKTGRYIEKPWVDNVSYDRLLSKNIAFVDLYDASACNSIIECIVRNTPILVNPLPAVVEYLGPNYPFYFNNLEEAAQKAENDDLILATHEYLQKINKELYTNKYFFRSFMYSEIGKNLSSLNIK